MHIQDILMEMVYSYDCAEISFIRYSICDHVVLQLI